MLFLKKWYKIKKATPKCSWLVLRWWLGKDSNLRRLSRQIYSLIPLTAREPNHLYLIVMVPRRGIEPLFPEWKSDVLTTERTGHWCRLSESNQSPTDYKSVALPDELKRLMSFKDISYNTLFIRFCQQKF